MFDTITRMGKNKRRKMQEIIQKIKTNKYSFCFHHPVDYVQLKLDDYLEIVKQPMDLSTISQRLKQHFYKTVQNCIQDLELIWKNCKLYNPSSHILYNHATKLQKFTKQLCRNYFPQIKYKKNKKQNHKQIQDEQKFQLQNVQYQEEFQQQKQDLYNGYKINDPEQQKKYEFLKELEDSSSDSVTKIYLMLRVRCPNSIFYNQSGYMGVNISALDFQTIQIGIKALKQWRLPKSYMNPQPYNI